MEELAKRKDIIITNADKGGAVAIMDVEKYINDANRQLSDKRNYKKLQEDPTLQHSNLINDTIDRFKKEDLLSKKLADGLKSVNPKTPKFYISPKIHKENNPGRPVINSFDCPTSDISRFIDHHLQPLLREIPSYIKDTKAFINKIDNFAVPPHAFLVTMDVKSSIPNNEGIASVKKKYNYPNKTIPTKIIARFLALMMTLNNFIFNSKFYLQIKGCVTGTICAPSCPNLKKNIYSQIKDKSVIYLRYIDNIFMVWIKSKSELRHFMNEINQKHQSVKSDFKFSQEIIEFLDTLVHIDSKNRLETTLYKKPTDCQNYLDAKSAHPF